jgi:hypothetical protein
MKLKTCLTPVVTTNTYDSLLETKSSDVEENKKNSPEDELPSLWCKSLVMFHIFVPYLQCKAWNMDLRLDSLN